MKIQPLGVCHNRATRALFDGMLVGRDPDCAISIASDRVSRRHCRFDRRDGRWVVHDLGSRNGTELNGMRITEAEVSGGDRLRIGPAELELVVILDAPRHDDHASEVSIRIVEGAEHYSLDPRRWADTKWPDAPIEPIPVVTRLEALYRGTLIATTADSVSDALYATARLLQQLFGARGVTLWLASNGPLEPRASVGAEVDVELAGSAFRDGVSFVAATPSCSTMVATLRTANGRLGAITLTRDEPSTNDDLELLIACANQAALAIESARLRGGLRAENERLQRIVGTFHQPMVGDSEPIAHVRELVARAGEVHSIVLIRGESGTGKELVARSVHAASARREGPFVALNCSALAPTLLQSELFGHEKGAFTGAAQRKAGVFEQANGGTLFLDEVAELSPDAQAQLLRVMETWTLRRVGATEEISVDVRVLAATHRDLEAMVDSGEFREDLFYRIQVLLIDVPPLRERMDDLPSLCEHLLTHIARTFPRKIGRLGDAALRKLQAYSWPGNVRELRNVLERAAILSRGAEIGPADVTGLRRSSAPSMPAIGMTLRELEAQHIKHVLETVDWNKTKAAKSLGVQRSTIYDKIKEYGLEKT